MVAPSDFPDEDIRALPRHARVAPLATTRSTPPHVASPPIFSIFFKRNRLLASLTTPPPRHRSLRSHPRRALSFRLNYFPRPFRARAPRDTVFRRRRLPPGRSSSRAFSRAPRSSVSFSIESRTVTRVQGVPSRISDRSIASIGVDRVVRVERSFGPRRGENVGRSRRRRRATEREPADGSRDLMSMGASPSERNHRFARAARARSRRERRRAVLRNATIAALVAVLVFLKMFYPGDQTLRSLSESWMRLMFSRRGISFGKVYEARFEGSVRLEAGDGAHRGDEEGVHGAREDATTTSQSGGMI